MEPGTESRAVAVSAASSLALGYFWTQWVAGGKRLVHHERPFLLRGRVSSWGQGTSV